MPEAAPALVDALMGASRVLTARVAVDRPDLVTNALDGLVAAAGELRDAEWWRRLEADQGRTSSATESPLLVSR
ncbi:hypothetical protein [Cryptosporangium arvum]|uniref:Uncharacterized protein n=1 Tax=Cryptosporangium arvum DSM 44712 TaxID=927661 RepID=A0A010ZR94_9ACTN|nr:hypothetical protein [Cryptosporangium arvum]EXG81179.1 hypothetical protein CryarDRAFT_2287 [Cryptosporangium arvum DSM 44712]